MAVLFDSAVFDVCLCRLGEATTTVAVRASRRESMDGRMWDAWRLGSMNL